MTGAQHINTEPTETPAPQGKAGMSIATRTTLGWLMFEKRLIPAGLLVPFAAAILRRQVTEELADCVLRLDELLDDQARLAAGLRSGDGPPDSLRIVQRNIDDVLDALHSLPAWPRVGDKVMVDVDGDLPADAPRLPGLVIGYCGGTSVRILTHHGEFELPGDQCQVTDLAVYVPAAEHGGVR